MSLSHYLVITGGDVVYSLFIDMTLTLKQHTNLSLVLKLKYMSLHVRLSYWSDVPHGAELVGIGAINSTRENHGQLLGQEAGGGGLPGPHRRRQRHGRLAGAV